MDKLEFYSKNTISKTLFLDRVDGNIIAKVQNEINKTGGMQVVATQLEPVMVAGTTQGKFYTFIYYKVLPTVKELDMDSIFVQKEAQSLLK